LTQKADRKPGGSFIIEDTDWRSLVTPEDLTEEQRMIGDATSHFIEHDVLPHDDALEKLDYNLTVDLLRRAGELGLLGADVPEAYGGLGLDKVSTTLISEKLARGSSFSLSLGAHVGIGTLPIVYFGTPEQKRRYLPQLASGERIAAYCLTEPSSGSDALGARTTARLTEDGGHYVLSGQKQFITNAGFADLFIVYAKVDGDKFSTFIVERAWEGVSIGPEERKMGIKGSSTCPLILDNVRVPVSNLLWEVGKGHLIAFNILNIGRFKLAAGCLGACKEAISLAASYANVRKQFGRPISFFPLIQRKLAEMNIRTYALESMVYRTAGLIDARLSEIDLGDAEAGMAAARAISEYALECSINKVFGSEALDFVADEGVQIHGGYGYIQDYKIERIYRDSRINRIFEGTNEINRLLIPGTLLKRAMKGELPLLEKLQALQSELLTMMPPDPHPEPLGEETHLLSMAKKIFLMTGGLMVQKHQMNLEQEQEMLSDLADMMILIYAGESALLRAKKLREGVDPSRAALAETMAEVYVREAFSQIEQLARRVLASLASGDELRTQLSVLRKLTRHNPIDLIARKRRIAGQVLRTEGYVV